MDLLTPTVNVPAERLKLRRLRNEINEQAQQRLKRERKFNDPGYGRLPDLQAMEPEGERRHGQTTLCPVQPGAALELLPTAAPLQELQPCGTADHQSTQSVGGQMTRRPAMKWDEKGEPMNLDAAAADALLWLDLAEKHAREKRRLDPADIPRLAAAREQLEKYLSVDARKKGMP